MAVPVPARRGRIRPGGGRALVPRCRCRTRQTGTSRRFRRLGPIWGLSAFKGADLQIKTMSKAMPHNAHSRQAVLSEITPFDRETGDLKIVIETPKGSRNKYKYEPENDCLELTTALPDGMNFPFDFGFIPSTLGEDGDPLDVLVLMDAPVVPGCVIRGRLIGVMKARQREM